jgi:FMN phosphatase YigB (HAD superfamily)
MVGDRADNDVEPARAHGWQTWHLAAPGTTGGGDWNELTVFLEKAVATV